MEQNVISKIIKENTNLPFGFCDIVNLPQNPHSRKTAEGYFSAIMFLFPYKIKEAPPKNISRYAAVPDYHTVALSELNRIIIKLKEHFLSNNFCAYTDASPILEVTAAANAGLGVIGKNGLLINKKYGSFVFIGEILTDIKLNNSAKALPCISCGVCKTACPVSLNKDLCLSKLTQKKGELEENETEKIKALGSYFGCDICQNVCPLNNNSALSEIPDFIDGYRNEFSLNEDRENRAYNWRGEEVIKRNFEIISKK